MMENKNQINNSLHAYDGSSQNNKEELKKLKQFSQSKITIYGLVILFFVIICGRAFFTLTNLEKAYPNGIPQNAMNEAFHNETMFGIYSAIGKWGFIGAFIVLSLIIYLMMIKPHLKSIKDYNLLIRK